MYEYEWRKTFFYFLYYRLNTYIHHEKHIYPFILFMIILSKLLILLQFYQVPSLK